MLAVLAITMPSPSRAPRWRPAFVAASGTLYDATTHTPVRLRRTSSGCGKTAAFEVGKKPYQTLRYEPRPRPGDVRVGGVCVCVVVESDRRGVSHPTAVKGGKPWLRGLAISFVTDAVDPTGDFLLGVYRRGVGGRCEKISLVTLFGTRTARRTSCAVRP